MVLKEADSKRFMKFLVNQTKGAVKPLVPTTVFRKFAKLKGSELGATAYANRFENYLVPNMDKMNEYSIELRIRVMFGMSAKVSNDFLEQIKTTGTVQVDELGRICKYTSDEGNLSLEGIHCKSSEAVRKRSTNATLSADFVRLMTFLTEKTKDSIKPLVASKVFAEFSENGGGGRTDQAYYKQFRRRVAPKMAKLKEYSIHDRVRVMFGLSGQVSNDFRRQIQTIGIVQLDDNRRICKFVSHDGKLKLEGNRKNSARVERRSAKNRDPGANATRQYDDVESSISYYGSPKRARSEMSSVPSDDEAEYIGGVEGFVKPEPVDFDFEELLNRDMSHNLLIDYSQQYEEMMMEENNQPFAEDSPYESVDDDMDCIESMAVHPKQEAISSDFKELFHRDASQEDKEVSSNWPVYNKTSFGDDMEYIGAVKGQPKPEPIDFDFYQINNREHFQGNQEMMIEDNNSSISERNADVPFVEHQQISLSAESRDTSAESESIYLHDFLKQLAQFISFFECSELAEIKKNIKEVMADEEKIAGFQKVKILDIRTVLGAFFFGVSRKIKSTGSNNSTMKVKDFMFKFKFFLLGLDCSELLELQQKVHEKLDEQDVTKKILLYSDIQKALQSLIYTISQ
ncbi:SPK domain-containing protein [Caenorhabditis elegans]|uniref:SPK domain-containing protein n=1 Tax=Caenorhabditis elegans TaxID=6239 RepID=Q9XU04_CAEEL|nr:SPK domain-containing protein [Caenorhabditis elegans]CAB07289.1 SPK domain-containing protein [Caenorhabditis elegans]|eukprot:NP_499792.1 Uncharacterized protein CELE_T28A8.6 [Caenorhabditis elegans]